MDLIEIKNLILKLGEVCDHCLGRPIALAFEGNMPSKIGAALRVSKTEKEIKENLKKELKIYETEKCVICSGIFLKTEKMFEELLSKLNEIEFNTFLLGCRIPQKIMENEENLWTKTGAEYVIPTKREINMIMGKKTEELTKKTVDFTYPNVVFILDFMKEKVFVQINSMFIFGRYRKLMRGLPQTKWPCRECQGIGRLSTGDTCKNCKGTGKQYQESVEELIAKPFMDQTGARREAFHGEGREDIDARMLGKGRPFVFEVKDPRKRNIDLKQKEKEINEYAKGKVEVSDLRLSDVKEMRLLKTRMFDKSYDCLIESKNITQEDLNKLEEFFKEKKISQGTPTRVLHRRADIVRKRIIRSVKCEFISKKEFRAEIKTEAGTYIKELVSSDNKRTNPSFTSVLERPSEVKELDVIEIHELKPLVKK